MPPAPRKKKEDDTTQIGWITVSYRSVFVSLFMLVCLAAVVMYFAFPQATQSLLDGAQNIISKMAGSGGDKGAHNAKPAGDQKAQFTMLDGTVKVKKKDSNTWVGADYNLQLEKGDVVQTGPEGMAKIVFADMTNYTVKQDSLIVIEENSTNAEQQTHVSVQVTTGTVDLATATYSQGSQSQVIVAGAKASLAPESSAEVHNDPRADQREIVMKKGTGEVQRNGEVVSLSEFDKVSFKSDSKTMAKEHQVGPPTLIDPSNMMPIFGSAGGTEVRFTWTPMDNAKAYHVRVSKNPYFSQLLMDKKTTEPELQISGMPEGAYYWSVQSLDERNKESMESERNRFTIIPRNQDAGLALQLEPFVQHGRIIEVRGKTDPSARVMVNGGEVPVIGGDGSFRYLTPPLPNGENVITITAQNTHGGVSTQTKKVVIQ